MAIDNEAKRKGASWIGIPLPATIVPDATLDSEDRRIVSNTYAFNAGGAPPAPATENAIFFGTNM